MKNLTKVQLVITTFMLTFLLTLILTVKDLNEAILINGFLLLVLYVLISLIKNKNNKECTHFVISFPPYKITPLEKWNEKWNEKRNSKNGY